MPSDNFLAIVTFLLPGFLTAWIFYGLTSHPKPSQFERTVEALIFTFIVQILVISLHWLFGTQGNTIVLRPYDSISGSVSSLLLAILFGIILAYFTNNDSFHKQLRKVGFTTRTSHPSEWYYVFSEKVTYVILHLKDGRRLYGWPKEWPVEPGQGQFYIMYPSWITDKAKQIDLPELDGILINTEDVQWVEFVKRDERRDEKSTN